VTKAFFNFNLVFMSKIKMIFFWGYWIARRIEREREARRGFFFFALSLSAGFGNVEAGRQ
jgi:hypothetical protein